MPPGIPWLPESDYVPTVGSQRLIKSPDKRLFFGRIRHVSDLMDCDID